MKFLLEFIVQNWQRVLIQVSFYECKLLESVDNKYLIILLDIHYIFNEVQIL